MYPQPTYPQAIYPQPAPAYPPSDYRSPITMPVSRSIPMPPAALAYFAAPPNPMTGKNTVALVSLLTSIVVPLTAVSYILSAVTPFMALFIIASFMNLLIIPCAIAAIITGHVALYRAKKYPPVAARRWMALTGLIQGYIGILAVALIIVQVFIALATYG